MPRELSQAGKEDVAFALILLKDFKTDGQFNHEVTATIIDLAQHLGVYSEFESLLGKVPPMKIRQRCEEGKGAGDA